MKAIVEYTILKEIEFTDNDLRKNGYEGSITWEDREEYLKNSIEEEELLTESYDDRRIVMYKNQEECYYVE